MRSQLFACKNILRPILLNSAQFCRIFPPVNLSLAQNMAPQMEINWKFFAISRTFASANSIPERFSKQNHRELRNLFLSKL